MYSVAIIEDDLKSLQATTEFLIAHKYEVRVQSSSLPAFLESLSIDTPPDVVLLDIMVGNANMLAHLNKIKLLVPKAKIIITTGHVEPDFLFQALGAGANGYYIKGSNPHNLLEAIQAAMLDQAFLSPPAAKLLIDKMSHPGAGFAPSHYLKGIAVQLGLNKREFQVLTGLTDEKTYQEIADENHISINTIRHYVVSLYQKAGVRKKEALIRKVRELIPGQSTG